MKLSFLSYDYDLTFRKKAIGYVMAKLIVKSWSFYLWILLFQCSNPAGEFLFFCISETCLFNLNDWFNYWILSLGLFLALVENQILNLSSSCKTLNCGYKS